MKRKKMLANTPNIYWEIYVTVSLFVFIIVAVVAICTRLPVLTAIHKYKFRRK